jgi:hypothetical protein
MRALNLGRIARDAFVFGALLCHRVFSSLPGLEFMPNSRAFAMQRVPNPDLCTEMPARTKSVQKDAAAALRSECKGWLPGIEPRFTAPARSRP